MHRTLYRSLHVGSTLRNVVNGHWVTAHYLKCPRETDSRWSRIDMARDVENYDVVIVGAGPAGLSAAIRFKQIAQKNDKVRQIHRSVYHFKYGQLEREIHGASGGSAAIKLRTGHQGIQDIRVCVVEKAAEIGAHTLSGAVIDPRGLNELFPDWLQMDSPVQQCVKEEYMSFLTKKSRIKLPLIRGNPLENRGNYIVRLGHLVKWLGEKAEELGVEIYPGTPAQEILFHEDESVKGVATGDVGVAKDGAPKSTFQRGMEIHAKCTIFAEGCRGHLTNFLIDKYELRDQCSPQTYAIGFKELWLIDKAKHKPGYVEHTIGYPLDYRRHGGSFIYHLEDEGQPLVALGLIMGLDYTNPYVNLYQEFQLFKSHPHVHNFLDGGERIGYGARAINEGGYQAIPQLSVPGACLIGCSAGLLNPAKIKGVHNAMKSGMIAAEAIIPDLGPQTRTVIPDEYEKNLRESYVVKEMKKMRNIRPAFNSRLGWIGGMPYASVFYMLLGGHEPWTFKNKTEDWFHTNAAWKENKIDYPKADGKVTFDLLSSVALTGTNHEENQPAHLLLVNDDDAEVTTWRRFGGISSRYCPAGVYEFVPSESDQNSKRLQINAQNCIHCKTCDIKEPRNNIKWVAPEAGGGPKYNGM